MTGATSKGTVLFLAPWIGSEKGEIVGSLPSAGLGPDRVFSELHGLKKNYKGVCLE